MTRRHSPGALAVAFAVALASCGSGHAAGSPPSTAAASASTPHTPTTAPTADSGAGASTAALAVTRVTAQIWADNWYALSINGQKIAEDAEPLTQVRSFNADTVTFTATYPLTIAMVTKDYTEGNSGLEYVGTPRQQMGDGGFIAQFTETDTGKVIGVTDERWQGLVAQRAPLDPACATSPDPETACTYEHVDEPAGWADTDFDPSNWTHATVYTANQVGPKGGYDTVTWNPTAKLIWTTDLFVDNTILWRYTAMAPR